jgi:gluconolactonase
MKRSYVLLLAFPIGALAWACSSSSSSGGNNNGTDSGPSNTADGSMPNTQDGSMPNTDDGSMPMTDSGGGTDGTTPGVNPIMGIAVGNVNSLGALGAFVGGMRYVGTQLIAASAPDVSYTSATIYDINDAGLGASTVFRDPSNATIGMTIDTSKKGLLLATEAFLAASPNAGDVVRIWSDGGAAVIANTYDGGGGVSNPMDSPNDITVRKSDGMIFVTDPAYQSAPNTGTQHVYRIGPNGGVQVVDVCTDGCRPNGIAISPDESAVYVGYSYTDVDKTAPVIKKFAVDKQGILSNGVAFHSYPANDAMKGTKSDIDGFAIDDNGNLYVCNIGGVDVFAPDGTKWGTIPIPGNNNGSLEPTALAFGGTDRKTLFISAFSDIFSVTVGVPGRVE